MNDIMLLIKQQQPLSFLFPMNSPSGQRRKDPEEREEGKDKKGCPCAFQELPIMLGGDLYLSQKEREHEHHYTHAQ